MPPLAPDVVLPGTLTAIAQPSLAADGLTLRPWRPGDRAAVVAAYADPAVQQWHARTMDDEEAAAWLARWPERWAAETGASWAVTDEGGVLGQVGLRNVALPDGVAEISYWVRPQWRGRRVAPRALAAMSAWALETLGLHRLELRHSTKNPASCRVAERAGFVAEGVHRSSCLHGDGWHDMHVHALIG